MPHRGAVALVLFAVLTKPTRCADQLVGADLRELGMQVDALRATFLEQLPEDLTCLVGAASARR